MESFDSTNACKGSVLVLINPMSGTGKSFAIHKKFLAPILEQHKFVYEVFVSQDNYRVGDFFKSLSKEQLKHYKAIVVVSGDGLFHETINSLLNEHWTIGQCMPLGIVPTGSGNGLAYTLINRHKPNLRNTNEAIQFACNQIIEGHVTKADVVKVKLDNRSNIWSFLSLGWGLLADIDIESEFLRKFGAVRFTIFGLWKCLSSKVYKGTLSYLQATDNNQDNWTNIHDVFTCVYAVYQSHISRDANFAPTSTLSDGLIYLTYVRGKLSCKQTATFLTSIADGSHSQLSYVTVLPVKAFKLEPLEQSRIVVDGEDINWQLGDGCLSAEVESEVLNLLTKP